MLVTMDREILELGLYLVLDQSLLPFCAHWVGGGVGGPHWHHYDFVLETLKSHPALVIISQYALLLLAKHVQKVGSCSCGATALHCQAGPQAQFGLKGSCSQSILQ